MVEVSRRGSRTRCRRLLGTALLAATAVVGLHANNPADAATAAATPVLAKRIIGYSVRHRPIIAYHLGNPTLKTTSLLIGQMHGNEHAGVTLANSIIHGSQSLEGINLWVIPTMNPDGNAANTRQNAHKVDLNRNWPDHWRHLTGEYYSGSRTLSEPETRAVHAFLLWLRPHYIVSLHQPLYGVDTTDGGKLDKSFAKALAHNLHLPLKPFTCWSACYGSMTGWYTTHRYGIAETIEFGAHPSHAYLVGTARRGIIKALHGRFGKLSARNPHYHVKVTAGAGQVSFQGWAYDPDDRSAHVTYRIYEGGRLLATHRAAKPAHHFSLTLPATAGRHRYCTVLTNIGAGTNNPRTCATVRVLEQDSASAVQRPYSAVTSRS